MELLIFLGILCLTQMTLESAPHGEHARLSETDSVPENRIFGGVPVMAEQYKFMVAILLKLYTRSSKDDRFIANGVIVHHKWALTTQNALGKKRIMEVIIRGNTSVWNDENSAVDHEIIAEVHSKQQLNCAMSSACQLVMYKVDPPFTARYEKKVRLIKDFWYPARMEVEVLGWGYYRYDYDGKPKDLSNKLRSVILRLQNIANCFMSKSIKAPKNAIVCTDAGFRGTCDYDVGGAMVSYDYLIALVIEPKGCRHSIDYYIRVDNRYVDWIHRTKKSGE